MDSEIRLFGPGRSNRRRGASQTSGAGGETRSVLTSQPSIYEGKRLPRRCPNPGQRLPPCHVQRPGPLHAHDRGPLFLASRRRGFPTKPSSRAGVLRGPLAITNRETSPPALPPSGSSPSLSACNGASAAAPSSPEIHLYRRMLIDPGAGRNSGIFPALPVRVAALLASEQNPGLP